MNEDIIYGVNAVREALRGTRRAFELFVARGEEAPRIKKLVELSAEKGVPMRHRERRDLARLCGSEHHQGVALRLEAFTYADLATLEERCRQASASGLLLVLDGIQDPQNLGALIRSAACAGACGVVIPQDRAARVTPTVEKASAGAVETVAVVQVANVSQFLEMVKGWGYWVYGAVGEAGDSLYRQDLTGNVALVVGSEGAGIRDLVRRHCDVLVSIPLAGGVSSLNASVAGAVCLFEAVRQRQAKP
jgi:23S rRNA (guanosine2251-2'-O)-methyltransferase